MSDFKYETQQKVLEDFHMFLWAKEGNFLIFKDFGLNGKKIILWKANNRYYLKVIHQPSPKSRGPITESFQNPKASFFSVSKASSTVAAPFGVTMFFLFRQHALITCNDSTDSGFQLMPLSSWARG